MDAALFLGALEQSLGLSRPEIFNNDQGVQFASNDFIKRLEKEDIRVSMDGRDR